MGNANDSGADQSSAPDNTGSTTSAPNGRSYDSATNQFWSTFCYEAGKAANDDRGQSRDETIETVVNYGACASRGQMPCYMAGLVAGSGVANYKGNLGSQCTSAIQLSDPTQCQGLSEDAMATYHASKAGDHIP